TVEEGDSVGLCGVFGMVGEHEDRPVPGAAPWAAVTHGRVPAGPAPQHGTRALDVLVDQARTDSEPGHPAHFVVRCGHEPVQGHHEAPEHLPARGLRPRVAHSLPPAICLRFLGSVVVAAGAGPYPGDVGAVDVQADGGFAAGVADAVDVTGRGEAADLARVVVSYTHRVERFVEQFFVLGALQDAHDAPGDVVVDPGALAGAPDQAEDGERAVGLGVQEMTGGPAGLAAALAGGQDAGAGQVRAEPVGDQMRGARPVGSCIDRLA